MGIDIPTTGEFGNCSLIGDINKKLQLKLKGIDKEKKDYYKNLLSKSCFFINNPNKNTIHNRNLSREQTIKNLTNYYTEYLKDKEFIDVLVELSDKAYEIISNIIIIPEEIKRLRDKYSVFQKHNGAIRKYNYSKLFDKLDDGEFGQYLKDNYDDPLFKYIITYKTDNFLFNNLLKDFELLKSLKPFRISYNENVVKSIKDHTLSEVQDAICDLLFEDNARNIEFIVNEILDRAKYVPYFLDENNKKLLHLLNKFLNSEDFKNGVSPEEIESLTEEIINEDKRLRLLGSNLKMWLDDLINKVKLDFENDLKSGLTQIDFNKESCTELYTTLGKKVKFYEMKNLDYLLVRSIQFQGRNNKNGMLSKKEYEDFFKMKNRKGFSYSLINSSASQKNQYARSDDNALFGFLGIGKNAILCANTFDGNLGQANGLKVYRQQYFPIKDFIEETSSTSHNEIYISNEEILYPDYIISWDNPPKQEKIDLAYEFGIPIIFFEDKKKVFDSKSGYGRTRTYDYYSFGSSEDFVVCPKCKPVDSISQFLEEFITTKTTEYLGTDRTIDIDVRSFSSEILESVQQKFTIKEDINTQESIEKIKNAFLFYKSKILPLILSNPKVTQKKEGYHGLYTHTQNVVFRGICYAVSLGEDPLPVVFACACHDLARLNNSYDEKHGKNAVPITLEIINNEKFKLTEWQKKYIIDAVENHTTGLQATNYIEACLRDADRTRLSWERGYREDFFNTELGKKIASQNRGDFIEFQNQCLNLQGKDPDSITPEEINLMLMDRSDIKYLDESLRKYHYCSLLSPQLMLLYDRIINLPRIVELSEEDRKSFFENFFCNVWKHCDVKACLEVVPSLISEGYDFDIINCLSIREDNKDIIKLILDDVEIFEWIERKMRDKNVYTNVSYELARISKFVNSDNFKYLKDCLELNDIESLPYFNEYTKSIVLRYLSGNSGFNNLFKTLDILHRRGHTLESVSNIFGSEHITPLTRRLLEFKDFDKFKNVGFDEYNHLSIEDKKAFLNGFISALTQYDILYPRRCRGKEDFKDLQNRMKIFREINWEIGSNDSEEISIRRLREYNAILKFLLNGIPDNERVVPTYKGPSNIHYRKEYREKNQIPPLVDDVEKVLDIRFENIKGRNVKVAELDFETDLGVQTHRFHSILSIEALEITDSRMLLAVGINGGERGLNVREDGYALIVKPRNIGDLYVQACTDIDSGTGASKNIYNFEHIMLPQMGNHGECFSLVPDAIKKELNLSQEQYTKRISALGNVTTLQEVGEKDKELELVIRKVLNSVKMYEGLITPTVMGISIGKKDLNEVDDDILDYCVRHDIPLVRIKYPVKESMPTP